uniref:Uncharacterized protein n=1 Tax=Anguilla anguilla TaxID=7936 RepID=A0A0E9WYU9_ANGAN
MRRFSFCENKCTCHVLAVSVPCQEIFPEWILPTDLNFDTDILQ